jgi:hypothetical protein
MTDNGSAYRSTVHALACRALGVRHLRTRPYRPQTNGKAERFNPDAPRRLGLWRRLRQLKRANGSPGRLARLLQSPATTSQPWPPSAHESTLTTHEQHIWVLHLGRALFGGHPRMRGPVGLAGS